MTPACDLLGIRLPIILAPMGGAVGPELAAAVSNAGGLGLLPLWGESIDNLRSSIRDARSLTSKPIGVNLNLAFPQDDHLEASLEEDVSVISFFWGDPSELIGRAKGAGATVMHTVGDAEAAKRAVDLGVDIVVAQGWEAGGHVRGMVATMPLVPSVVDQVGDTPVVAAGGIADGRGLAAALALGAGAGWIGTRFLLSNEATIHPHYRQRIIEGSENDTVHLMDLFDGGWPVAPHRTLINPTVADWESAGRPASGDRPGEGEIIAVSKSRGEVKRYDAFTPRPDTEGDIEALSMWAGQSVGLANRVQPAAAIVEEIMSEAKRAITGLVGKTTQ